MSNSPSRMIMIAAVDMDCDGPATTVYRALVPVWWTDEFALQKMIEWSKSTYFGPSDYFPVSMADFSVGQLNGWQEYSDLTGNDNCSFAYNHFSGKPQAWR